MGMTSVLTATRLQKWTEEAGAQHRGMAVTAFARSLAGRPLTLLTVGAGDPHILCVATHHAMEWICGYILLDFAEAYFKEEAENMAPRGTFHLVPLLNPDGVSLLEAGVAEGDILAPRQRRANGGSDDFSHWQANGRGVDLNHNYPTGFDAYRAIEAEMGIWEGAPTRYSGVAPLSEPETQGIAALVEVLSPDVTLALHTQGEEVCSGSATGRARMLAELAARRLGYRHIVPTGAAAYGGLTDWLTARGMRAMTLECGRGVNPLPATMRLPLSKRVVSFLFSLPNLIKYVNNL